MGVAETRLSKGVRLDMGDTRGRWEGNSLVVETTNFRDRSVCGLPSVDLPRTANSAQPK